MVSFGAEFIMLFHVSIAVHGLLWFALRQERRRMERLSKEVLVRVANSRGVW